MENILRKAEAARDNEGNKATKNSKINVMKEDKEYLKNLEKNLLSESYQQIDPVKSSIMKTVKNANEFLQERELFWMYFD